MEAVLNLSEKPLVFVTCPKHVLVSCLDKTIRFFFVSSVSCMIVVTKLKKKKKKEFVTMFLPKKFQLSHVFLSVLTILCALIKYTFIWLSFKFDMCKIFLLHRSYIVDFLM
jgi:hypothetical protein